jgi:RNA polymerase sigma-70 factor (ECF subfamily)
VDERDVEEFCRRVSPKLVGALVLQCNDQAVAEDLAQEALARAWEHWGQVSAMAHPEGWMFRVAFNLTSSHGRRVRAARRAQERSPRSGAAELEDVAGRLAMRDALSSLPERQRAAVVCRYYLDLSVASTAEVLGCAEGTVKALCHQAIERLREILGVTLQPENEARADG